MNNILTDEIRKALWTLPSNTVGFTALLEYMKRSRDAVEIQYRQSAEAALMNPDCRANALILKGHVTQLSLMIEMLNSLTAKIEK